MTVVTNGSRLIIITFLILILLFPLNIGKILAEDPHFVIYPHITNKNLHINTGIVTLELDLNFNATGFGDVPLSAFLTTSGGSSNNILCIGNGNNYSEQQKALFGSAKGQIASITNQRSQFEFRPLHISLTASVDQTLCPNNKSPIIRSVLLQDVELHLVQNDGSKYLMYPLGDLNLPIGYLDMTPNG